MPIEPKPKIKLNPSTYAAHVLREAELHATNAMQFAKNLGLDASQVMAEGKHAYQEMVQALGEPVPADITNR